MLKDRGVGGCPVGVDVCVMVGSTVAEVFVGKGAPEARGVGVAFKPGSVKTCPNKNTPTKTATTIIAATNIAILFMSLIQELDDAV